MLLRRRSTHACVVCSTLDPGLRANVVHRSCLEYTMRFGQGDFRFFLLAEICLSNAPFLSLAAKLWLAPRTHLNYCRQSEVLRHQCPCPIRGRNQVSTLEGLEYTRCGKLIVNLLVTLHFTRDELSFNGKASNASSVSNVEIAHTTQQGIEKVPSNQRPWKCKKRTAKVSLEGSAACSQKQC
jgi:hypothetical protein